MGDRTFERLTIVTALTASLSVGAGVLLRFAFGGIPPDLPVVPWLICYFAFLATLAIDWSPYRSRLRWLTDRGLLALQVSFALAVYLLAPHYGWSAVLLVITAAASAYVLPTRDCLLLVAGQTVVIAVGNLATGVPTGEVTLLTLVYGSFQLFAVLMVSSERREAAARANLADAHAQLATAHAELRASSALLAESSRTGERLRIARELHDLVGHQLTALSLQLEVASHHADGSARDHVLRARDTAKGLLADVRAAVGDLRAPSTGLRGPLQALVEGIPRPAITLRVVEEALIDQDRVLAVVRCVQEIVTNTLRHADAENLWITVRVTAEGIHLDARDDGRGSASVQPGNGLAGMRERLEQFGGEIVLDGAAGQGFRVAARVPVA